jgi:hypothetical protein
MDPAQGHIETPIAQHYKGEWTNSKITKYSDGHIIIEDDRMANKYLKNNQRNSDGDHGEVLLHTPRTVERVDSPKC